MSGNNYDRGVYLFYMGGEEFKNFHLGVYTLQKYFTICIY